MEKYFAADTPEKAVEMLIDKSDNWFKGITDTNYIDKINFRDDLYLSNVLLMKHLV